jgi:hypothetical protein
VRDEGRIVPLIGQSSIRHPFACRNDVPGGNNLVLGWENKLADTVSENKMTANEIQSPAMVAEVGHMGNVGLSTVALPKGK